MLKASLSIAALAVALVAPAAAQDYPGDNGLGLKLGLAAVNSSGQVGSFTIFNNGGAAQIVVNVKGAPDRPEAVTITRVSDCAAAGTTPAIVLGNALNGRLTARIRLPFDRLTSGNYSIVVHNNTPDSRAVVCGQIYNS